MKDFRARKEITKRKEVQLGLLLSRQVEIITFSSTGRGGRS